MRVDFAYSEPHYWNHMASIRQALPPEWRGEILRPHRDVRPGSLKGRVVVVASYADVSVYGAAGAKLIHVEHGAGQSYRGDEKSAWWPGYASPEAARHYSKVIGFICPNRKVADAWAPKPTAVVGCPKLDHWLTSPIPNDRRAICFAWHWDCKVAPEARAAWPHYSPAFPRLVEALVAQGFTVYAHQHPKWRGVLTRPLERAGATVLPHEQDVFRAAGTLVVDNSSIGMEFLALGRPVVWLNAPWYRRNIDHGGRFWDWTENVPTFDNPEQLLDADWGALTRLDHDPIVGPVAHARDNYAYLDGSSSRRAADFIMSLLGGV